ncbi:TetR/AcrR family transcriptional regulator [Mycolicibacterium hodleri]|uniref:TetR/AcrR family transcriptional regulator n=1 Tax=Mycolicibacterium hodleri TaxID=49897 RepID=A0A502E490_9MYCO|nr:TetR/AcrR family transcriptional regulator [Mycolicibacterium hodleri]TPG32558.1 TetR/AcrR family transcriptional regulator [Mycolicibacterium hodleri]
MAPRKIAAVGNDVAQQPAAIADDRARPRGRPRSDINLDAAADAVAELFAERGMDAVSIPAVARKLEVSRATLYRTIATKEELLGVLFERSTQQLTEDAVAIMSNGRGVRERLSSLVGLQVEAAVRMQQYMPVFFGGAGIAPDVFQRWHTWSREYESLWAQCVQEAMDKRVLKKADVVATTRLLLGMCIWVSRWYRPSEGISTGDIIESAIRLLPAAPVRAKGTQRIRRSPGKS